MVSKVKEIESSYFVWAVIATIASANATIINHLVKSVVAVSGGDYGTNVFARRVIALLA